MSTRTIAQISGCMAAVALLGACATRPQVPATAEAGRYLSRANRSYTPPGPPSDPWGPYIREAAAKYDVPDRWIREVMRQESGGHLFGHGGDLITSGAGAMGLMQVMPATYDELRARYAELGDDPFDPHNNILAGTAYIREMYDIYGSPGFLAAYNAGPGRLDDYLTRNRVLPQETRRYVAAIGPRIAGAEPRTPSPGAQYALNALPFSIPDGPRYSAGSRYTAPSSPVTLGSPVQLAAAVPPAPLPYTPSAPPAAEAPSAGPYIVLRPQPVEVAAAEPPAPLPYTAPAAAPAPSGGPYIVLRPQPVEVAEAAPVVPRYTPAPTPSSNAPPITLGPQPAQLAAAVPPRPFNGPAAAPRPSFGEYAALPRPPAPVQFAQAPSRMAPFAQFPEPPRPVAPAFASREQPSQRMLASAALVPLSPSHGAFSLVTPANAEPLLHRGAPSYGAGNWAVQVGAYANESLASSANASARDHARDVLGPARSSVTTVRQPHGTLFRARLTGLSRDAANQACERLAHARATCMVVSPDAQL